MVRPILITPNLNGFNFGMDLELSGAYQQISANLHHLKGKPMKIKVTVNLKKIRDNSLVMGTDSIGGG